MGIARDKKSRSEARKINGLLEAEKAAHRETMNLLDQIRGVAKRVAEHKIVPISRDDTLRFFDEIKSKTPVESLARMEEQGYILTNA